MDSYSADVLDRRVAFCYSVMRNASVFVAKLAIANGLESVRKYVAGMEDALVNLIGFQTALACGTNGQANNSLEAFGNFVVEVGINLKYHEAAAPGIVPAQYIQAKGALLKVRGLAAVEIARTASFNRDLSRVLSANQPSLNLSTGIICGLELDLEAQPGNGRATFYFTNQYIADCVRNAPVAVAQGNGVR